MNNMKYYNESLAYDFEMFMPRKAESEQANIVKIPKSKTSSHQSQRKAVKAMSVSAFAVMTAVFMLAALCTNIGLRLEINEVNDQINDIKSEINMLDSVQTELEVEYDRRISYSNLELAATELGMSKRTKDQVRYIRVNDTNAALTKDGVVVNATE
ncbi:MAG: hypothetical protein E7562_06235 [Ruminococcaceae bacterium]|nr:hypothetical protein [Oscillospiraceae bacterium]